MIDSETFERGFEMIIASFSRTITGKNINLWHAEVENSEPDIFRKTCYYLKRGEKFPNFGDFHKMYQSVKEQAAIGMPLVSRGCGDCHNGFVLNELGDPSFTAYC